MAARQDWVNIRIIKESSFLKQLKQQSFGRHGMVISTTALIVVASWQRRETPQCFQRGLLLLLLLLLLTNGRSMQDRRKRGAEQG